MESLSSVSQRSLKRSPQAWIAAITPTVCAAAGGVGILVCGWMMNAAWLIAPLSILITIIAIPVGVLLLGSCFAVPLGIAAIANESDPDPLDSLSRGFESFYRRPLHLAGYLIVAMACVVIVWCIATGVAFAAVAAIQAALSLAGTEPSVRDGVCGLIAHLPIVVTITTMWGMLGGVYLLSRESTGGQQVEDLWQPQVEAEDPLPRPASLG